MTIVFDLDGTLADSFDYVADFLAGEARRPTISQTEKDQLRHLSMSDMVSRLGMGWWRKPFLFFKGRRKMREAVQYLPTFKGIPELIAKLHAEGNPLFVLSANSLKNMRPFLREHKIEPYFKHLYGKVGLFKAPALRRLLREQAVEPAKAVYIGDEVRDVIAAKAAGMKTIAVSWGFADREHLARLQPDALVDTPAELRQALKNLERAL